MPVYGPGYSDDSNGILSSLITSLSQLIENLLAGATPAAGSVTDAKVAADAAIAQSKIAGLVSALATLTAADISEAATRASADTAEATTRAAAVTAEASARATADALLIPLTQKAAANGVATLGADSKIPGAQLPALAIGEVFPVISEAAMLALTAQRGDVAVRTDLDPDGFFLLTTDSPATLGDWVRITAAGSVTTVDGQTGTVVLSGVYLPLTGAGLGGATASDQLLKGWVTAEAFELTVITRDSDNIVTTATVKWPDGSGGTFTTVTKNTTWLAIDAYTVSHTLSAKTVTQAAVTRNGDGAVTVKPALTVA